jgi:hypothetical protein
MPRGNQHPISLLRTGEDSSSLAWHRYRYSDNGYGLEIHRVTVLICSKRLPGHMTSLGGDEGLATRLLSRSSTPHRHFDLVQERTVVAA